MKYIFCVALVWFFLDRIRHPKHPLQLNVYFGVPGSGKTTYAAYLARQAQKESIVIRLCRRFPCRFADWILSGNRWKRAYPVWSNVPIAGTLRLNAREDIGVHMIMWSKNPCSPFSLLRNVSAVVPASTIRPISFVTLISSAFLSWIPSVFSVRPFGRCLTPMTLRIFQKRSGQYGPLRRNPLAMTGMISCQEVSVTI